MNRAISFLKSCDGTFCDAVAQLALGALCVFVIATCLGSIS